MIIGWINKINVYNINEINTVFCSKTKIVHNNDDKILELMSSNTVISNIKLDHNGHIITMGQLINNIRDLNVDENKSKMCLEENILIEKLRFIENNILWQMLTSQFTKNGDKYHINKQINMFMIGQPLKKPITNIDSYFIKQLQTFQYKPIKTHDNLLHIDTNSPSSVKKSLHNIYNKMIIYINEYIKLTFNDMGCFQSFCHDIVEYIPEQYKLLPFAKDNNIKYNDKKLFDLIKNNILPVLFTQDMIDEIFFVNVLCGTLIKPEYYILPEMLHYIYYHLTSLEDVTSIVEYLKTQQSHFKDHHKDTINQTTLSQHEMNNINNLIDQLIDTILNFNHSTAAFIQNTKNMVIKIIVDEHKYHQLTDYKIILTDNNINWDNVINFINYKGLTNTIVCKNKSKPIDNIENFIYNIHLIYSLLKDYLIVEPHQDTFNYYILSSKLLAVGLIQDAMTPKLKLLYNLHNYLLKLHNKDYDEKHLPKIINEIKEIMNDLSIMDVDHIVYKFLKTVH